MLIFQRKPYEQVVITVPVPGGEDIQVIVTLVEIRARNNAVRIGFEAPRFVTIDRAEIDHAKRTTK